MKELFMRENINTEWDKRAVAVDFKHRGSY